MSKFSDKFGYSLPNHEEIIEDAPTWLRISFLEDVLSDYVWENIFLDDYEYHLKEFTSFIRLLSNELHHDFREDISLHFPSNNIYEIALWKDYLEIILRAIAWHEFYDVVEFLGKKILNNYLEADAWEFGDGHNPSGDTSYLDMYEINLKEYIRKVNSFFEKNNVRWRLDDNSELQLLFPDELIKRKDEVIKQLSEKRLETTRTHLNKAERFITRRPIDSPNSIKEIVSALESLGTFVYPNVKKLTLTRMANEMEKSKIYPEHLLTIIRKFFDYANSETAVRHGNEQPIRVKLEDAEFCFHLGIALLQYIMSVSDINHTVSEQET